MPSDIEITSVQSRGILWQAIGGVSIRIVTADTLGPKYRRQLTVQMICGNHVVASTSYSFRRVRDRTDLIENARASKRLEFIAGTYSISR